MSSLLKVSEAAALALHAMACLARRRDGRIPAREIARATRASPAHLSKVLGRLERAGLVRGTRGPAGGYALARPPQRITLKDIYEQIEGPLGTTPCLFGTPVCSGPCMLGSLLEDVDERVEEKLRGTRLSDLDVEFRGSGRRPPKGA